ncbi:MAG: GlsB/YeaQ/YmgE family stress response membrane protein [Alphaproteobacteria bacterium]|nr:GlsB/YeaQ/YmgE family stress response membrane protein [Alphaproteobacteria bacterium]
MVDFLAVVVVGFVVGLIARFVLPGRDPGGLIVTTVIGVGGSLLATYGGQVLGLYMAGQPAGFAGSVIGAIALLVILRFLRRP